jgi:hypothetical protein
MALLSPESGYDPLEDWYSQFVDFGFMTMSITADGELEYCWTDYGLAAHGVASATMNACVGKPTRWNRFKRHIPAILSSAAILLTAQAAILGEFHISIVRMMFHIT